MCVTRLAMISGMSSSPRISARPDVEGGCENTMQAKANQTIANQISAPPTQEARGLFRWLTSTNHKEIGTLYLWFSFAMFLVGGIMAMCIRAELLKPGLQFLRPELFDQLTTLHGLVRVCGAVIPLFVGFAT